MPPLDSAHIACHRRACRSEPALLHTFLSSRMFFLNLISLSQAPVEYCWDMNRTISGSGWVLLRYEYMCTSSATIGFVISVGIEFCNLAYYICKGTRSS
jgi:hypothetical protein